MIAAYNDLKAAEAKYLPIIKQVRTYQNKILADNEYYTVEWFDGKPQRITDTEDAYLMGETEFDEFIQLCIQANIKNGFIYDDPEICPLVVAKQELRNHHQRFLGICSPMYRDIQEIAMSWEGRQMYFCVTKIYEHLQKQKQTCTQNA